MGLLSSFDLRIFTNKPTCVQSCFQSACIVGCTLLGTVKKNQIVRQSSIQGELQHFAQAIEDCLFGTIGAFAGVQRCRRELDAPGCLRFFDFF